MPNKLDGIITVYLEKEYPDNPHNEAIAEMLKREISQEIVNNHIDRIQNEQAKIQATLEHELQAKRVSGKMEEAKDIAIVAIAIGFLVGFLVNQITEVTFVLKGNAFNLAWTIVCILGAITFIYMSYQRLYIHKILHASSEEK